MSPALWITIGMMAALPWFAAAQEKPKLADPSNPVGATPSLIYDSPFVGYRTAAEPTEAPDKIWRASNAEMGRLRGHMGHTNQDTPPVQETPAQDGAPPDHPMHHKKEGK